MNIFNTLPKLNVACIVFLFFLSLTAYSSPFITSTSDATNTFTIQPSIVTSPVGVIQSFHLLMIDEEGYTANVTNLADWSTDDSSIVLSVDKGLFFGISPGSTSVVAAYKDALMNVSITKADFTVINAILVQTRILGNRQIQVGETSQLNLVGTYTDGTEIIIEADIKWSSSHNGILSIDENGSIHGNSDGAAIISAQYDGLSSEIAIIIGGS